MDRIAFLGMGVMGRYMAANLARSNRFTAINVWNRNPFGEGIKYASTYGSKTHLTIYGAVKDADCICLCLSNVAAVRDVLFAEDGAAKHLKSGSLVLDFSTIGPPDCREIASLLDDYGVKYVDVPVSGGDVGAMNGTLTLMIGSKPDDIESAGVLFSLLGSNLVYAGGVGNGQLLKAVNQVLCAINTMAVCEAMTLAAVQGIPLRTIVEACSGGAAGSWALNNLGGRICENDLETGFQMRHMLKDLSIAEALMPEQQRLPAMSQALQTYEQAFSQSHNKTIATQGLFGYYQQLVAQHEE